MGQNIGEKWDQREGTSRIDQAEQQATGVTGTLDALNLLAQGASGGNTSQGGIGNFLGNMLGNAAAADSKQYLIIEKLAADPQATKFLADTYSQPGDPKPANPNEAREFLFDKLIGSDQNPGLFARMPQASFDAMAQDPQKFVHMLMATNIIGDKNPQIMQAMAKSDGFPCSNMNELTNYFNNKLLPQMLGSSANEMQKWANDPVKMAQKYVATNEMIDKFSQNPTVMEQIAQQLGVPLPPGQVNYKNYLNQNLRPYIGNESDQKFQELVNYANNPLLNNPIVSQVIHIPNI